MTRKGPTRRRFLGSVAAGATAIAMTDGCKTTGKVPRRRMPVAFVAHGSPTLVNESERGETLRAWADALPRPRAILAISAHWQDRSVRLGATETIPLVYDFYGFPQELYEVQYPAPGAPDVAARVRELAGVGDDPARGLDHGVWTPLMWMYPDADVPVVQVTLPKASPADLYDFGRRLAPLRDEDVLILGSGNLTHNLRAVSWRGGDTPSWAASFDDWCADVLARGDRDALLDYERRAPDVAMTHPTREHFEPLLVCAGAALDDAAQFPITGFSFATLSNRCVQFG